ncbi:catecholate siderophore receptor [Oceanospirillum multiglobuliferum]|uniref:TonB-dependent siderophore receptor n=1 Tax=Oceanospirillum multiglobuliferum TaxID=64969 RepID=A0A1T4NB38_9GAMM|nr:TonB-dependent siderophore receptor [Oceanospirillum multiglobuliferum]OPX55901.1 hypothetical protein BTE48_06825 [Oceanospirillum multiglobuliferum]SJZ76335.1 catecholate siderophore receptor [Oceanospirillum multiglobuliferum]
MSQLKLNKQKNISNGNTALLTQKHQGAHLLASAITVAISSSLLSAPLHADNEATSTEKVQLQVLDINSSAVSTNVSPYASDVAPYKAEQVADKRRTRDIVQTPQTIQVLTKTAIEESGKTELKDLLQAQPGITLGTGEGGNTFGDRYIIRGYEARNDVFTDGLRDPGPITRETFSLEQVEISKGPSSTFAGRGSTGGAVNSVTKKASIDEDFTHLEAGLGTDNYQRYTLDTNHVINDDLAVRLNVLYSDADTPDRAPAGENRQGLLLSGLYNPSDDLRIYADYYRLRTDDRADTGVFITRDANRVFSGFDDEVKYVGQNGLDFQKTEADVATLTVDSRLSESMRIENKTRYGTSSNEYIITASRSSNGQYTLRHFTGWQENQYLGNQTNLIFDQVGDNGQRNTVIAGVELARENVDIGSYSVNTNVNGASSVIINPYAPDRNAWQGSVSRNSPKSEMSLDTLSFYLMDTLTLNPQWELSGGVRYDSFDYSLDAAASTNRNGSTNPAATYAYKDSFVNGQLGVVFSPWDKGNVYFSWSTSSNINGGEADAGTNCGYGGLCTDAGSAAADPEQSTNLELGTKWSLMNDELLLTAAVFQTTKDNVIETSSGSTGYGSGGSLNTGKNEVKGVELGLVGNLTNKLSGHLNITSMKSKVLESSNAAAVGLPQANFADTSANLQLRYQLTEQFAFGGAATYSSEIYGGSPEAGTNTETAPELPSYTVLDAFASYQVNPKLGIRANVQNLTDKRYYTAVYRGGSIVYLGDARSANISVNYKF